MIRSVVLLVSLLAAAPAASLVVDAEDPASAEVAPSEYPGWGHVGRLGGVSAVYLGDGWVLASGHGGVGAVEFGGEHYPAVPNSRVDLELSNEPGTPSDLVLFRVDPAPDLPKLDIATREAQRGALAVLIGYGFGRGEPVAPATGHGYHMNGEKKKRWGTNRISRSGMELSGPGGTRTRSFRMDFSRHGTPHEAEAAEGDSGGAVFVKRGGKWELSGLMLAVKNDPQQPANTALYGNYTNAADLGAYSRQIRVVMARGGAAP